MAKKTSGSKAIISKAQSSANKKYSDYYHSSAYKNAKELQGMNVNDIAKKYGLDFSHAYAAKQAKTAADAQRVVYQGQQRTNDSNHTNTLQNIQNSFDSAGNQLDTKYFNSYGQAAQDMANRGLNAGIAANANVQLGMNKQNDLADLWKQTNTQRQQENMRYTDQNANIYDNLAQVAKQQSLDTQNNYQNLLTQGLGILNNDRNSAANWANTMWGQTSDRIGNDMNFANMNLNDYYKQQDLAQQAANRAASLRAAKLASGGGSGGGSVPSSAKSYVGSYVGALNKQSNGKSYNTGLDSYANNMMKQPGFRSVETSKSPLVHKYFPNPYSANPTSVANNPSLSAWDKYKLMGL